VLLFVAAILCAIMWEVPVIRSLDNQAFARGLITFTITLATIGIAFLLVYQAVFSEESSDDRFRRAREVFGGLMGVLGTIVGFYFGSAAGVTGKLDIAEIKSTADQVITHVSGGVPPYRYSITSTEKDFTPINDKISTDGWIMQKVVFPKSGKLSVDVLDSRDLKGSRDLKVSP
jgi:hypothetical protein